MEEEAKVDYLKLALNIADTIHDMVQPKKTENRRCVTELRNVGNVGNVEKDSIYNLGIVTDVFSSMPEYKSLYDSNPLPDQDIINAAILKLKTYTELNAKLKLNNVSDFENYIVKLYNKRLGAHLSDKYGELTNINFIMRDYVPL